MIKITTCEGLIHLLETLEGETPDYDGYTTSINTQNALRWAYENGDCELYIPPEPEPAIPEPLPPDWKTFRLALLKSKSFRLWSELLPSSWREDLKAAAMMQNAEALQDIYDYCKSISPPITASKSEWQQLANKSSIPVTF